MSAQVKTTNDTPVSPSSDVLSGTGYQIVRPTGRGGMGHVYEAIQTSLQRPVAVKLLDRRQDAGGDPACAERMVQEARVLARFDHENIVRVFHLGNLPKSGDPYVVMELLKGETLNALLRKRKKLSVDEALRIMFQVLAGLEVMHEGGYAHRDLKPHNIFLTTGGVVKLIDFGAVKALQAPGEDPFSVRPVGAPALTMEGAVIGTVLYLAPEQLSGRSFDHRVDIYAAGILLYRMLAGRYPFEEKTDAQQAYAHLGKTPPPLTSFVPVPIGINNAVMRAIEKRQEDRFQSAQEFSDVLTAAISGVHPVSEMTERGTVRMSIHALATPGVPRPPSSSPGCPPSSSPGHSGTHAPIPLPMPPPSSGRQPPVMSDRHPLPTPELLLSSSAGWSTVDPSPVPPSVSVSLRGRLEPRTIFLVVLAVCFSFGILAALMVVIFRRL